MNANCPYKIGNNRFLIFFIDKFGVFDNLWTIFFWKNCQKAPFLWKKKFKVHLDRWIPLTVILSDSNQGKAPRLLPSYWLVFELDLAKSSSLVNLPHSYPPQQQITWLIYKEGLRKPRRSQSPVFIINFLLGPEKESFFMPSGQKIGKNYFFQRKRLFFYENQ